MADVVARQASGCTAQKAPINAVAEQPTPVMRVIHSWPFASLLQRCCASSTWSVAPLAHTVPPVRKASAWAATRASPAAALLSTPRVRIAAPAELMISEPLPRITVIGTAPTRRSMAWLRYGVAPAPTGSSTRGMPRAAAARSARSMDWTQYGSSVPMLTTRAWAIAAMSSTSSWACAITGAAPAASSTLALKLITTRLVMLWTSGVRSRTAAISDQSSAAVRVCGMSFLRCGRPGTRGQEWRPVRPTLPYAGMTQIRFEECFSVAGLDAGDTSSDRHYHPAFQRPSAAAPSSRGLPLCAVAH